MLKGRVSRLCAWANCHVRPFTSIAIKTMEITNAGNGNNAIEVDLLITLFEDEQSIGFDSVFRLKTFFLMGCALAAHA